MSEIKLYDKDGNEITGDDLRIDPSKLNLPKSDYSEFFDGMRTATIDFNNIMDEKTVISRRVMDATYHITIGGININLFGWRFNLFGKKHSYTCPTEFTCYTWGFEAKTNVPSQSDTE